ncbi:MAG: hypothetical protein AAF408_10560 [Pseudomonadota bacterium]
MAKVTVKVVVDDAHVNNSDMLEGKLRALGLEIEEIIPEIGVVFGTAEEESMEQLRALDGVAKAEPEQTYQLPPFKDDIPQ